MALGGGTWLVQNKKLPGTYINFVSVHNASAVLSDRGIAAIGVQTGWGKSDEVFYVTNGDFQKNSRKIFGYAYDADELKGLRDLFAHARELYCYRLDGGGTKARNNYATAQYEGTRGNDLKIVIQTNVDNNALLDVSTYLGTALVDKQTVATAADLADNDYLKFNKDIGLELTAGIPLAGGTDGTVTGDSHQALLDKMEGKFFNVLGCVSTDDVIKRLYVNYTKRLRDEMGKKFVCVVYNLAADYEGVINVKNKVTDSEAEEANLVYWVTGLEAGTAVNASATNRVYDGEYTIDVNYTQKQLENAIDNGEFVLHQVDDDIRVLTDIDSLVTTSDTKGDVFKNNQTIRVIDQIANDIAVIFNTKYLGVVPNDVNGRISLWSDICKHHQQLQDIRAIEDFEDTDVTVEQGDTKSAVLVTDIVTVINAMEKLYMTVTVQ